VGDVETDGLLAELTRIHSLVLRDVDTNEVVSCTDDGDPAVYHSIEYGLRLLEEAERTYWHNGIGFDIPAITKVYPKFRLKGPVIDTFIVAAMRWAHIREEDWKRVKHGKFPNSKKLAGSHSLEAWGHRLGKHKGEYKLWCKENGITEPFAVWRQEMQDYCTLDTDVTRELVLAIRRRGVSAEAVETELGLRDYIVGLERNGVPLDVEKAVALQGKLAARREELAEVLRQEFGTWTTPLPDFIPKRDNKKMGYKAGVPVKKFKTHTFNPASTQHISDRLMTLYGWVPEKYTDGGQPQVDESTLAGLTYPPVAVLKEYLLVNKRLGQLAESKKEGAWLQIMRLNALTGMQHIHGRVNQNGTITGRATHSSPNLSAVPKVGKPFGAECRELFTVPPGWVMVGADASGLEARCMGHHLAQYDGGAFIKAVIEGRSADGTDIHSINMRSLGITDRDRAKTWFYAFVYGAGDEKLGRILFPDAPPEEHLKIGKQKKKEFFKNTPALKILIDSLKPLVTKPGYLIGLDGRRVYTRSEHSVLNTQLQSDGAVVCKRWGYLNNKSLTEQYGQQGWNGQWAALLWSHDEYQMAVRPEIADAVKTVLVSNIESLTEHFHFRCPLTGAASIGQNWRQTH
jgi:DNA polymerase I-like protein with 3'-5' exonuclease and polymerase domains